MNMASMGILLIVTVISISVGSANTGFISLKCNAEKLGQYGQQSLLECVIDAPEDTVIRVVTWKKASLPLLVFDDGHVTKRQGYSFAEPSWNDRSMNVSLLITNTAVEHDGRYECMVLTDSGVDTKYTSLKVTAKYSKPTILTNPEAVTLNTDGHGTLTCQSVGGYPEGKLRWFDELNGELTNDSRMEAKPTESGLFRLSSKLVLGQGSDVSEYTCRVYNASGGKEEEATFKVLNTPKPPESRKDLDPTTKILAPVVVIGSLIVGLLFALLIYKRRSRQARRHSTAPLMGDHQAVRASDVEEGDEKC